jgi:hypothetical protein
MATATALPTGAQRIGPLLRRHFGDISRATALRWILKGLRTPDGQVAKLKAWRLGSRVWYSTEEDVRDFLSATTVSNVTDAPQVRSPRERERASSAAKAKLRKLGL